MQRLKFSEFKLSARMGLNHDVNFCGGTICLGSIANAGQDFGAIRDSARYSKFFSAFVLRCTYLMISYFCISDQFFCACG